jgi:lipopolysaccharide/colanic/teichoic acid biosynthesis glycosyltransferase
MNSGTYPLTANVGKKWQKLANYSVEPSKNKALTFLYIGNEENAAQYFSNSFESGDFAQDFAQVQSIFDNNYSVPDAIIIDIPLNKAEHNRFYNFLKNSGCAAETVIIYSEKMLDAAKIKFLKQYEMIDEVLNIDSADIDYAKKISFLKKIKANQANLNQGGKTLVRYETDLQLGALVKRSIDVLLVSIAILFLLPVFLIIAIAVRLGSRGPVIYTSQRAGRGFKVFKFYKFRTMEVGADKKIDQVAHLNQYHSADGKPTFLKISNDPRITRIGHFLRKSSLDELPQLFNVLKGDMSLVGNRPLPLYEAYALTTNDCVERFMAPAGMTGLWQIKKRGRDNMSTEERINLDIVYARKNSIAYDFWIMANTPGALLQKSNV